MNKNNYKNYNPYFENNQGLYTRKDANSSKRKKIVQNIQNKIGSMYKIEKNRIRIDTCIQVIYTNKIACDEGNMYAVKEPSLRCDLICGREVWKMSFFSIGERLGT